MYLVNKTTTCHISHGNQNVARSYVSLSLPWGREHKPQLLVLRTGTGFICFVWNSGFIFKSYRELKAYEIVGFRVMARLPV
jgi:hypothetical protein